MASNLKSTRQIQAEIIARLASTLGLNDVNPGSVMDRLTQAVAQQDFSLYYQIAQVTRLVDIDALTGTDLDNKAFEYGLERELPAKSKGTITIFRPVGFVKVSTTFYAGAPSPIAGDTIIDVNDASNALISTSGTLVLGRGTNNEEEVTYSAAPVNNTNYWRFTLDNPLTNFHAVEETVILKQGSDETILAGTAVVVPATGASNEIKFTTDSDVVLLSGEDFITGVEITAAEAGTTGNISIGSIDGEIAFPSPPFPGARARNSIKFSTGKDLESDDDLRDSIKKHVQGLTRAVKQAISNAINGLVDPNSAKRVVSSQIVLPIAEAGAVKVYIDDGTGFEPSFESSGFETLISSATGGEQRLQVAQFPIVKAQIQTNIPEPFDMSSGILTLTVQVGTIQESIQFNTADFRFPALATAEEIVSVINDRSTIIEARTSQGGTYVLITAKRDVNESIQVISSTANAIINFPTDVKNTIELYIDDVKKSKDGATAILDSGNQAPYNFTAIGAFPHELTLIVDGKAGNPVTAIFNLADVADPAAVTAQEVVDVINRDVPGLVASAINEGAKVRLESLTKLSSTSKLKFDSGSANNASTGLNFDSDEVSGSDGDYIFNRELGIIELTTPLTAAQNVTLGNLYTRAKLRAGSPELYAPANATFLRIIIDGAVTTDVTFDGTFAAGLPAEDTAAFINLQLKGGTAIVRTVGGINYLEIMSNTYAGGSIEIDGASTANSAFSFDLDEQAVSGEPNKAYVVAGSAGPYSFAETDNLVVVVDDDIVNNTFSIPMTYGSTLTGATSGTVFADSTLGSIFPNNNELVDFYIAFQSGANTETGVIETVTPQSAPIVRYSFNPTPANFANYAVGDLFKAEDLDDAENNGYFVITGKGADWVEVRNADGLAAVSQAGTATLSQRRRITAYNQLTGGMTVGSAFTNTPSISDPFIVLPSTVSNVVQFIKNTKLTSFTLKGSVEGVEGNSKLQLSSNSNGSDGSIQVTGGGANTKLNFPIIIYKGLQAYSYYIELVKLVHRTIYGDDSDLKSFPGFGAAGIVFRILGPTVRNLVIAMKLTLKEGVTISSVQNEIKSAVSGYVNTLGVGDDVIMERIRAAVINVPGLIDVVLTDPTANIAIADNEKAAVADTDITIG